MADTTQSFTDLPEYQQAYQQFLSKYHLAGGGGRAADYNNNILTGQTTSELNNAGSQFRNYFNNLIGRDPTQQEASTFYSQMVQQNPDLLSQGRNLELGQAIKGFIGDNYQQAAKTQATQQLQDQSGQAKTLADQFRTQGNQSIDTVQQSLLDYQQKLFDRLRPQLITSLQSQGLLNTGGLNEAVAGAQGDLATAGSGALLDARMQNENAANQIQYAGASAPYQYQQSQIMNQVPYLQGQSQNALDQAFQTFTNNNNFSNQMALLNRQGQLAQDMQPSMLSNLGQHFVSGFGTSAGNMAPSFMNMGGGLGSGQKQPPPGAMGMV